MRKGRFLRILAMIIFFTMFINAVSYSTMAVFDPANWAENFFTAMQAVQENQQLLNQIENQMTMIRNDYQNLRNLHADIGDAPLHSVQDIDAMLGRIQGVGYTIQNLERSYQDLYQQFGGAIQGASPGDIQSKRLSQIVATANTNMDAMKVQTMVIEGIRDDLAATDRVLRGSRNAQGNLDVQQYGNELSAMQIKQQVKTQQLLAAQNRLESVRLAEEQSKDYAMEQDYTYRMREWGVKKSTAVPLNDFPH